MHFKTSAHPWKHAYQTRFNSSEAKGGTFSPAKKIFVPSFYPLKVVIKVYDVFILDSIYAWKRILNAKLDVLSVLWYFKGLVKAKYSIILIVYLAQNLAFCVRIYASPPYKFCCPQTRTSGASTQKLRNKT